MQQGKKLHDDQAISIKTGINITVYGTVGALGLVFGVLGVLNVFI